jgi:negative regulator of replication initiation
MANDSNMEHFAVRLPGTLRQRIHEAAQADGRTPSNLVRRLLDAALDPQAALTNSEKLTHGAAAKRHAVLGFVIEDGRGALPVELQAQNFIADVARAYGEAAADVLRSELNEAATPKAKP